MNEPNNRLPHTLPVAILQASLAMERFAEALEEAHRDIPGYGLLDTEPSEN